MRSRLELTRWQVLGFRRSVGALDQRLAPGGGSLRRAAWAGLQGSMPRAALLSIQARVEATRPSTWEDPSLVQLWGPRYHLFVVAARDLAVFSLGTLPDDVDARRRAEDLAARLHSFLDGARMSYWEAGRRDEPTLRAAPGPVAPARLLPSGDAYLLLQGADRELLVPDTDSTTDPAAGARRLARPAGRVPAGRPADHAGAEGRGADQLQADRPDSLSATAEMRSRRRYGYLVLPMWGVGP